MPLIIDGYNLLHVTGIFGRAQAGGTLEASRMALLDFLVASLATEQLRRTIIVFDAKTAPLGLPREYSHQGLQVRFADPGQDADSVIEALIEAHTTPRNLTIVSSDHRIQRAARRRSATALDSDHWYLSLRAGNTRQQQHHGSRSQPGDAERQHTLPAGEVQNWLSEFGPVDLAALTREPHSQPPADARNAESKLDPVAEDPATTTPETTGKKNRPQKDGANLDEINLANPFPPGYADDLFDE